MCGIAGLLGPPGDPSARVAMATRMATTLAHRGPDDSGAWSDERGVVGLGFRRLSIIDLSPAGHQPMSSADGRYTVVFNGEIYNFAAIREELVAAGCTFRGGSDTEVLLQAVCNWGVEAAIDRSWGMFGLALWDGHERVLHLVRDRLGKKPIYYGWQGDTFLFGSELKALRADPHFEAGIDRDALASYLATPTCRHRGPSTRASTSCRPAATWCVRPDQPGRAASAAAVLGSGHRGGERPGGPAPALGRGGHRLARDAAGRRRAAPVVRRRAARGVPVRWHRLVHGRGRHAGATARRPVQTFTIGFEASRVRRVEPRAGPSPTTWHTDHTELMVTPEETRAVIPRLATIFDEPFADASQIPTFLVSRLARQNVTVALSGDGGDEVFGGYNRYVTGMRLWSRLSVVPRPARTALARGMEAIPPRGWDKLGSMRRPDRCPGRCAAS